MGTAILVKMEGLISKAPLSACQIMALLSAAPSTVSEHLYILRAARLVDSRKDGHWMYYRLSREFRTPAADGILPLLFKDMERTKLIAGDRKHLKKICREDRERPC